MKNKVEAEEQLWFDKHIGSELQKLDQAFEQKDPDPELLQVFVSNHQGELRRKLWRDLMLFWLVAAFLLLGMIWLLDRNWIWFATFQALFGVAAISFVGLSYMKKVKQRWRSN